MVHRCLFSGGHTFSSVVGLQQDYRVHEGSRGGVWCLIDVVGSNYTLV